MPDLVMIEYWDKHPNWMPIATLFRLAARLLGADLISIPPGRWVRLAGLSSCFPRFRRAGKPDALVVARVGGWLEYDDRRPTVAVRF